MTTDKARKRATRDRMAKTGERYATALHTKLAGPNDVADRRAFWRLQALEELLVR
jgi:hypothetical protein